MMSTMEDTIKEQNTIGQDVVELYNHMVSASFDEKKASLLKWKEKLEQLSVLFTLNDVQLQEFSEANKKNEYFKTNYAGKVKNHITSGKCLIEKLCRVIGDPVAPQPKQSVPKTALAKRFQFALRELEDALEDYSVGAETAGSIRRLKDHCQRICEEYIEHFEKDELTASYYSLKGELKILLSGASKEKASLESLPFSIPSIEIPEFRGDYTKWNTFKELFLELIDAKKISKTQKMVVLKSVIKGDAETTIANLPPSEANYDIAWKLLNEKYTNKRAITTIYFRNLVDAPHVDSTVESVKQFKDNIQESLQALQAADLSPDKLLQAFISFLLVRKMGDDLRMKFEASLKSSKELPQVGSLLSFLEHQFYVLEAFQGPLSDGQRLEKSIRKTSELTKPKCIMGCKTTHLTHQCLIFKNLNMKEKWNKVIAYKLCVNCLKVGHSNKTCNENKCKICNRNHNTLLHKENDSNEAKSVVVNNANIQQSQSDKKCVLLSTAIIEVSDAQGNWINCRALLDNGSQVCFITKSLQKKLNIKSVPANATIEGIAKNISNIKERLNVCIKSKQDDYKTNLDVLVVPQIISDLPANKVVAGKLPDYIKLADPSYFIPSGIDMLIGAELFYEILLSESLRIDNHKMVLQNTLLGWIVSGPALIENPILCCKVASYTENTLDEQLRKFWEVEEINEGIKLTKEEIQCEENFEKNVCRKEDGRFVVQLPFKIEKPDLGNSEIIAKRRFLAIERKLKKNPELNDKYHSFLREYLELGHMELANNILGKGYYLPHHYVLRPERTSTKLRVVFDASCKTSFNNSLNDLMHTGPRLQDNLFDILLRFRKHKYVISGDIEKMFRQIWVHENHCNYQMIFWRSNPSQPLQTYRLKTVTYGTNCAPYLATKCLQIIANSVKDKFPKAAEIISSEFYMDDLLTGSDSLDELKTLQLQVYGILKDHGFHLRKWCSNNSKLLENFPEKDLQISVDLNRDSLNNIKALGMAWNPSSDEIFVKSNWDENYKISKRNILSDIAKLFDPLGLLAPVTVMAKILLQELWKLKIDWDATVPDEIATSWKQFRCEMIELNKIKIPRHMICDHPKVIELYGFCDASMKAYGAAVYIKSIDRTGKVVVKLVASKSRVAPVKVLTIPRLELCAAVLLIDLMKIIVDCLKINFNNIFYFTDSTIVLSWLKLDPATLQVFVSNRINYLQTHCNLKSWRYVSTRVNPADIVSRGIYPSEIISNALWFEGPTFIKEELIEKEEIQIWSSPEIIPEVKNPKFISLPSIFNPICETINHKNNFEFLQNVVAYILKYINLKTKREEKTWLAYKKESLVVLLKIIQKRNFPLEVKLLKSKALISSKSKLKTLSPFLDKNGLLRVGGRIQKSNLAFDAKHPILLPYADEWVYILIEKIHRKHLHIGPQGLLAITRQQFWRGKELTRKVVKKCYRCFKANPRPFHQFMGNLPEDRVIRTRPFLNVGIDFLGPLLIHHKIRGKRVDKVNVCVFVCFSTKAAHLEVVSDMTSASFIGALKRFVGRRSCPLKIYSDNGTNFVGAANSLNELNVLLKDNNPLLKEFCVEREIEWINIPARSPHVGGLWEACVKSVKKHFYRINEGTMTFEEMCTLMTQIEAVLNSRPITPLSDDPNDMHVLTPGHFLIGEPLTSFRDCEENKNYKGIREHWKAVCFHTKEFWKRWSIEYLSELQKRYKWQNPSNNIQEGALVLLKEDNVPPMSWRRGRVEKTSLGEDGLCRIVDVRTSNGVSKRSIHNVCRFPIDEKIDEKSNKIIVNLSISNKDVNEKGNKAINQNNKHVKHSYTHKNCKKIKNKNCLLTILSLLLVSPKVWSFDLKALTDRSGIFFEDQGVVKLQKSTWLLVAFINLTTYINRYDDVSKTIMQIRWICAHKELNQTSGCQKIHEQLSRKMFVITDNNKFIIGDRYKRIKRAPLSFIGSIQHALFGIMDEEHAQMLEEKVKKTSYSEAYYLQLLKNMSSIQDVTSNVLKKQSYHSQEQFVKIQANFENVMEQLKQGEDFQQLNFAVLYAFLIMDEFEHFQEEIKQGMLKAYGNGAQQHIITSDQLQEHLDKIKLQLPYDLRLPAEEVNELFNVLETTTQNTREFILFEIRIPLVHREAFTIFEIHPYPTMHDSRFVSIQTSFNHLLFGESRKRYYNLRDVDFLKCKGMRAIDTVWICPQTQPIYNIGKRAPCEVELLLKKTILPGTCVVKFQPPASTWIQLNAANTWLYSVPTEEPIEIECQSLKTTQTIENQGIIRLDSGCHLYSTDVTLVAFTKVQQNVTYVSPAVNITFQLPKLNVRMLKDVSTTIAVEDIPKMPPQFLGIPIDLDIDTHHITHYGISALTWIALIIVIIIVSKLLHQFCQLPTRFLPSSIALQPLQHIN